MTVPSVRDEHIWFDLERIFDGMSDERCALVKRNMRSHIPMMIAMEWHRSLMPDLFNTDGYAKDFALVGELMDGAIDRMMACDVEHEWHRHAEPNTLLSLPDERVGDTRVARYECMDCHAAISQLRPFGSIEVEHCGKTETLYEWQSLFVKEQWRGHASPSRMIDDGREQS